MATLRGLQIRLQRREADLALIRARHRRIAATAPGKGPVLVPHGSATSAALRAVGRFWELTPPRLRRAGIPIHLAEGQSNAREQQVRGALNGLTPSASHCTHTLQAMRLKHANTTV